MNDHTSIASTIDGNADPVRFMFAHEWDNDTALRKAFGDDFDRYAAYRSEVKRGSQSAGAGLSVEARARVAYLTKPALWGEFSSVENFLAYTRAVNDGRVAVAKPGVAPRITGGGKEVT